MAFPWLMARRLITEEGDRAVRQGLAVLLRGNGEAEFDLSAERIDCVCSIDVGGGTRESQMFKDLKK
jgi:ethanolamine utilization protein EutA (predicted chaperonin)